MSDRAWGPARFKRKARQRLEQINWKPTRHTGTDAYDSGRATYRFCSRF